MHTSTVAKLNELNKSVARVPPGVPNEVFELWQDGTSILYTLLMDELWQLFDEQGRSIPDKGASKEEVFSNGLLHGAAHVWIWRTDNRGQAELLLQKRAANKRTWPSRYDISAAGHIDLGEEPIVAALREAKEEINLDITESELKLFAVHRAYMVAENGSIENEYQWLYLQRVNGELGLTMQQAEVDSVSWKNLVDFKQEVLRDNNNAMYVPHGNIYYENLVSAIENELRRLP